MYFFYRAFFRNLITQKVKPAPLSFLALGRNLRALTLRLNTVASRLESVKGWDKGISFDYAYQRILSRLRNPGRTNPCYALIALIQLANGSRASEAVRAFQQYLKTREAKLSVKLSKKKTAAERLMVIPQTVQRADVSACIDMAVVDEKRLTLRYKVWVKRNLGLNSHSLRYAFVTHLVAAGLEPTIVAKITGHSKLDFILHYTQRKRAEGLLEEVFSRF